MTHPPRIYLDYAATTPVLPEVRAAMDAYFDRDFGNPSSVHRFGQRAEAAVENSREIVARALNCRPAEIVFTSCGSESDNLAVRGAALAARQERNADRLLITPVEHHAVSHTAQQLTWLHGFELDFLPVDEFGRVVADDLASRLDRDVAVVSIIYANNEIGTINHLAELAALCRSHGVPFHTDAVQAGAYLPLKVDTLGVDLMSLGGHKFYGPKGVGALYVREGTPLIPLLTGGSQESGRRAGTHNVPYIVGFAEALKLAQDRRQDRSEQMRALRDRLIKGVLDSIPEVRLTGHPEQRLPNHASFVLAGVDGNALLAQLDNAGFACSSGSACKTGSPEPSDVLAALGFEDRWSLGSLRVTLGRYVKEQDIAAFLAKLPDLVADNRRLVASTRQITLN